MKPTLLRPCFQPMSARHFSRMVMPLQFKQKATVWKNPVSQNKSHLKHDQSKDEVKEQKLFDKNQETLERMEHDSTYNDWKKPDDEKLKKIGDDARIEQNRPDDGVY